MTQNKLFKPVKEYYPLNPLWAGWGFLDATVFLFPISWYQGILTPDTKA